MVQKYFVQIFKAFRVSWSLQIPMADYGLNIQQRIEVNLVNKAILVSYFFCINTSLSLVQRIGMHTLNISEKVFQIKIIL